CYGFKKYTQLTSVPLIFGLCLASCGSIMSNCTRPDGPALLEALRPVFDLSSIRPVMNVSTTTLVNISFILIGILGVVRESWRNEFIGWDPNECGSHWITVPRKVLWVPDIVINELNSAQFTPYTYVYHDGTVFDLQPVRVVSSCRLDIYTFPFDVQNCTLTFNSYLHSLPAIQIGRFMSTEEVFQYSKTMMTTMGEWELTEIKSFETVTKCNFHQISVRRRSMLYVVNLLIPSCFLITVDLFSFLLPPQKVDRSLFKMTLILGFTVFLLLMNDLLPITGNTIPLISVFLSLCLALMVVSLLETILITNLLHSSTHYSEVPRWIRLSNPATLGETQPEDTKGRASEGEAHGPEGPLDEDKAVEELRSLGRDLRVIRLKVEQELNVSQSTEDWNQVGFIIDRLLFAIYILFLSVSFICIIGMWVNSYNAS
uniref:Uncharacterized protein n=1 Tax=Hippocampus comes TaxID=109280 RepID=A0A3Q2Z9F5_HIPCM